MIKKTTKTSLPPAPATTTTIAPAPSPKPSRAPRIKPPPALIVNGGAGAPPPRATIITAKINVGYGKALFLRGEGPGLSWTKGVPLDCVAEDRWVISIGNATGPIAFKFLLNDETWSTGNDYSVEPGGSFSGTPQF